MSAGRRGLRVREERLRFRFDGREIEAQCGDSTTSALIAAGVRVVGRSVKYRRPRGVFTAGLEEPNALFSVGPRSAVIPNVPGTGLAVTADLDVRSQNRWPTLRYDVGSLLVHPFRGLLGAGFYYKTFMWPSWRTYEGLIRRLAGLGEAPADADVSQADVQFIETDVLVAGAGPAGLSAALAAARAGARVLICERDMACGGELEFESAAIDGRPALDWVAATLEELRERHARVLTETAVIYHADRLVVAHRQSGGLPNDEVVYRIRPKSLVIAMGAVEHSIAFIDNDLPGVMLAGEAERYLARYGARVGSELVLFGNHDRLYAGAARLLAAGIRVRAVVDTRREASSIVRNGVGSALRGVECLSGQTIVAAYGRNSLRAVGIAPLDDATSVRKLTCDALLVSGGWSSVGRRHIEPGDIRGAPEEEWRFLCGAYGGDLPLAAALQSGYRAGRRAAAGEYDSRCPAVGFADPEPNVFPFWRSPAARIDEKRQFVDLQNDVTVADLRQAVEEGFVDIEHAKRYTTLGVGTEQGRTSGLLGVAILGELTGKQPGVAGMSRARPPILPVTLTALCGHRVGDRLRPERRTPLHELHKRHSAVLGAMGEWVRPRYYADNGPDPVTAGLVEAARVRSGGGILDASTIGKIEFAGADAAAFLDSLYLTPVGTIAVGRARYGVNLREDGMVLDDGLIVRFAEDRFLATVSSGHALGMLSHFEFWHEMEWSSRSVAVTDVTDAWAIIVVAGPESRVTLQAVLGREWREVLAKLEHMNLATGTWRGVELRALRASFTGELAYELYCRPSIAPELWNELHRAGLRPYGIEALDVLRIEKGYLSSPEINGQTTPQDLRFERLLRSEKQCLGAALLSRPAFMQPERPRLVGVKAEAGETGLFAGAQVVTADSSQRGVGHVTSATYSPALAQWIGLALIARCDGNRGAELVAVDPLRDREVRIKVVSPAHFDADGQRMRQ